VARPEKKRTVVLTTIDHPSHMVSGRHREEWRQEFLCCCHGCPKESGVYGQVKGTPFFKCTIEMYMTLVQVI
jgi:hypothetical protein